MDSGLFIVVRGEGADDDAMIGNVHIDPFLFPAESVL